MAPFSSNLTNFYSDVFINYHGAATKKTFARSLYDTLLTVGLKPFLLDHQEFQEGNYLSPQIQGAIRSASVLVSIFSPRYAESSCCLEELLLMLESRATIIPVFYGVTPAELRLKRGGDGVYAQALRKLEEKRRYGFSKIEKWSVALSKVADISGFEIEACYGDEGLLLERVVERVLKKFRKLLHVTKYPTGLNDKVKDFENKVLLQQSGKPSVAGIVGSGGVGKTTLAKELFNRMSADDRSCLFLSDVRENARNGSLISLQRRLLESLNSESNLQIQSIDEGKKILKRYLSSSRAFIILDDVDEVDQVDALFPDETILRSDSLILITSRNKDVLRRSGVENASIYKLTGLNDQHSTQLFCAYAFCQPYPLPGFEYMVDSFLEACDGLPLSLEVFGALLYGKDMNYWKEQLDRVQRILPSQIQDRLQISYNSLNKEEQQIFLDIACFFIGEDRDKAIRIWDGSGWKGGLGFQNLQNKSLVDIDCENHIRMHDHLRDLGRDLAERELGGRPWRPIDSLSDGVFQQSSVRGLRMVESRKSGQSFEGAVELGNRKFFNFTLCSRLFEVGNRFINFALKNSFVDMGNRFSNSTSTKNRFIDVSGLQLLRAEGNCLESISNRLRDSNLVWLCWDIYPYTSLPVWVPKKNLRVLEVAGGELETLWQTESEAPLQLRELNIRATLVRVPKSIGQLRYLEKIEMQDTREPLPEEFFHLPSLKHLRLRTKMTSLPESLGNLRNLHYLDLSGCTDLQTLPISLGNLPSLKHINLNGCSRLEILPESFGNLSRLQHLSLGDCSNLTISSITFGSIKTLESLQLSSCRRMQALPPQVTDQSSLEKLNLSHTNLTELPIAIGNLSNLEILKLQCPFLEMLPSTLGKLRSLKELTLHFCDKLRRLPDSVGQLGHLTTLTIHYAPIEYLPVDVMRLNSLEILNVRSCPLLEVTFSSVEIRVGLLDSSIEKTCLTRLRQLDLQGTRIKQLSFCEGVCPNLQRLNVSFCHELVEVGALPTTLISLELQECPALKEIRGLPGLAKLRLLDITGCNEIKELPGIETLTSLGELRADGCNKVKNIGKLRMNIKRKSCSFSHLLDGKRRKS